MTEEIIVCEEKEQEKTSEALEQVLQVLKRYKLRTQDLILLYANLGYSLGISIEKLVDRPGVVLEELSVNDLQKIYYEKPTLGIALMLQSLLTTTWADDYNKSNEG